MNRPLRKLGTSSSLVAFEAFVALASLASLASLAACGGGSETGSTAGTTSVPTVPTLPTVPTVPTAPVVTPVSSFSVSSVAAVNGTLPADYTCDGSGSTAALAWANAPSGTTEFALLMTTLPGDGSTKYNWVLYGIPAAKSSLAKDSVGVGTLGVGSDGPIVAYQPPCSQGLGEKSYTFTLYALSAAPVLPAGTAVSGSALATAMASVTLCTASLSLSCNRSATAGGLGVNCGHVIDSLKASTSGAASVGCDGTYAYVASNGLATHAMMNGITASNLQVPIAQNFFGSKAWKIPLAPAIAATTTTTTTATDGPIGMAINGVPIFNPCKQGGCQNGDTKVLGELDVCNGHAGRADDHHYHAAPTCLMAGKPAAYWDTHPLGWALDGFAIYGYNNADGNTGTLANGPAGYSYHVTDASPYVLSCFRGTPSPDLAGQGAKFTPLRQPPVTPFPVSAMTQTTDAVDGYQVLQFTASRPFTGTETGTGSYRIRFKPVTDTGGATTQPTLSYCR